MCGRYVIVGGPDFFERFDVENNEIALPENYNAAPGQELPVITRNSPNSVQIMKWGLIPPWAKDVRIAFKMINARAETITEKPAYKKPFHTQRCIVPFNSFYEWKRKGKEKTPFLFHDKKQKYLSFAGLYEIAHDADGKEIKSYTIVTTAANKNMQGVHDRMPVILSREEEDVWLNHDTAEKTLIDLLDGYSSKTWEAYEVSRDVNSAQNNDEHLIEPAPSKTEKQHQSNLL